MPPTLTDYEYAFGENGIVLNTDFNGTLPFIDVTDITGLDSAPQRVNSSEREGVDGTYVDNVYQSMRTVVITGTVYSANNDESFVLALKAQYSNPAIQRFYFQHPTQSLKFVNASGGGAKYDIDTNRRLGITNIQLTLLCGDPYIYDYPGNTFSTALNSVGSIGIGFGFNFNYNFLGFAASGSANNGTFAGPSTGTWVNGANLTLAAVSSPLWPGGAGLGAMSMTSVAAGNMWAAHCLFVNALTQGMDCSPGDLVQGSVALYAATTLRACQAGFAFFNSAGTQIGGLLLGAAANDAVGSYTVIQTGSITAPAGAVKAVMVVQVNATGAAGEVHYVGGAGFTVMGVGFSGPGSPTGLGFGGIVNFAQTTLENLGSHTAYPIITLHGPLTNPTIQDALTSITMKLNMTLGSSDVCVVDCNAKSILVNGISRRNTYRGRAWFTIPPGAIETYYLSADAGSGSFSALAYNTYY